MTEVVVEVEIDAPVAVVWRLLTDPKQFVRWLGVSADLDPRPDGTFRFELFDGQFCSGRYLDVVIHRRLVFTWGWEGGPIPVPPGSSTVTIDLIALEPGRTSLRLVHGGLDEPMRPLHADGWQRYLGQLTAVAEGDPRP